MTISLEHLADGDWEGLRRVFDTLQRLVIDTGGLSVYQRRVEGRITNTGTLNSGTGFTVSKTGVGLYAVVFTKPFPAQPGIRFGSDNGGFLRLFWTLGSAAGFTANVQDPAGSPVDAFINFEATYQA